jgi:hypothetical protein
MFPTGGPSDALLAQAGGLFSDLMRDFQANSIVNKRGVTEFQEFNWGASKPIIDQIDVLLARHFGLSDDDLDFVITYDLKYRGLGQDDAVGDHDDG